MALALGKVKFFRDDQDEKGRRSARAGQWVEFDAEQTEKGIAATSVTVIPVPAGG